MVELNDSLGQPIFAEISDGIYRLIVHDIAITGVLPWKDIVCQGNLDKINVTVLNEGEAAETFEVTLYTNSTLIGAEEVTNLSAETYIVLTFVWNTSGFMKGNYTICAIADTVPNEAETADNIFIDNWIIVSMIGDIIGPYGWPDGKVDIRDIAAVANRYGSSSGSPNYNPNFDIFFDGKIDVKDLARVAKHYGEVDE